MLCVISSFLIVDRAIARSLYYAVILIFVYIYLYSPKHAMWKILGLFMCGAVFVLIYWILRYSTSEEKSIQGFFDYFSRALSSYFSGVNVVSGSFNLPKDINTQFQWLQCFMTSVLRTESNILLCIRYYGKDLRKNEGRKISRLVRVAEATRFFVIRRFSL